MKASKLGKAPWSLAAVAIAWSGALLAATDLVPVYRGVAVSSGGVSTPVHATLIQENGLAVLAPAAFPLVASAIVAVSFALRRRRLGMANIIGWVAASLAALEGILGLLTIGIAILPVACLLVLACALAEGREPSRSGDPLGTASPTP